VHRCRRGGYQRSAHRLLDLGRRLRPLTSPYGRAEPFLSAEIGCSRSAERSMWPSRTYVKPFGRRSGGGHDERAATAQIDNSSRR
jgi:hypothetical protein